MTWKQDGGSNQGIDCEQGDFITQEWKLMLAYKSIKTSLSTIVL